MEQPPFISIDQLESHLWKSANILRGPVDATDFKTYVFPLLFFKHLSDVHDEEYQAATEESGGDEDTDCCQQLEVNHLRGTYVFIRVETLEFPQIWD